MRWLFVVLLISLGALLAFVIAGALYVARHRHGDTESASREDLYPLEVPTKAEE